MDWKNILEAICAAPSIILEQITISWKNFWIEEKELSQNGEFEKEETMEK